MPFHIEDMHSHRKIVEAQGKSKMGRNGRDYESLLNLIAKSSDNCTNREKLTSQGVCFVHVVDV